ncbi:hypothetical protein ACT8ZV_02345 [Nocardioides sp. MAHUQ-72]
MSRSKTSEEHDALSHWVRRHPVMAVLIVLALIAIGLTFRFLKATT